jgi:lincosamide nucleotidyltransferase A/C/D/E
MLGAERVLEVLARVPGAVVDGGWGVDALLGEQTREHDDLDLIVPLEHCDAARDALGYTLELDARPTRVVLADGDARIDLHLVSATELGMAQLLPGGTRFTYVLDDTAGTIAGEAVRCLSAPMQVLTHCGYEPDAADRADMTAVAAWSGESLPPPYLSDHAFELRPVALQDVAALAVVRQRSWISAYTGRMPQGVIDAIDLGASWMNWSTSIRVPPMPSMRVTVAGPRGGVTGFSVVSACRDQDARDDVGELRLLYADPTAWNRGVGSALLHHAVATLRSMGFDELRLWTLRDNERARAFYERNGWTADGAEQLTEHPRGSYVEARYRLVGS